MKIISLIVKIITLPGAVLHTFFEHMSCRFCKILVDDASAIRFDEMLSHVDHQLVRRRAASFDICFIPFLINLILGFMLLCNGSTMILYSGHYENVFNWISLYLGFALCCNLFPQREDVLMLKENVYGKNSKSKIAVKIIIAPFYAVFRIGNLLEDTGLIIFTSAGFAYLIPYFLGLFVPKIYNLLSQV